MFPPEQAVADGAGTAPCRVANRVDAFALLGMFALLLLATWLAPAIGAARQVTLLTINDAIGPATADYIVRGIERAEQNGSQLVILKMDTPGGLDTSMRSIIKAILQSPVPVASYVAPGGARAASAGTYIMYASHIAAMAPGTNLGAATPVQIGAPGTAPENDKSKPGSQDKDNRGQDPTDKATASPSTRKQVNDAAAYIRGLAQMRGRNVEWAERAVREAVSLPADEALKMNVIDYVAADVPALLQQLDGKKLNLHGQQRTLQTTGATVDDAQPDWRAKLLATITNPSIALILMSIGIYGLMFEFMNPGLGVPGVIGGICLLLALYALQLLPVNYAGLALILLGLAFMIAEAFMPSFGIFGLGGVAAFIAGAVILMDTEVPGFGIPLALVATVGVISALLMVATVGIALKTRQRTVVSGASRLIGCEAEIVEDMQQEGWAHILGETWRITSPVPLQKNQKARVTGRKGLVLEVMPVDRNEKGE